MSCKWIEGFETHTGSTQTARKYASATGSFSPQAGRVFGNSGGPLAAVAVTPSLGLDNTWVIGFGVRLNSHSAALNSGAQGIYMEKGTDEQYHLEILSTTGVGFQWRIMRGSTEVDISASYDFGVWHYFELKVTARTGSNGAYELRHNGVLDTSGTSLNMADEGTDGADIFAFRYTSNVSSVLLLDDIYVLDSSGSKNNDFLGPSIVEKVEMTATGDDNDFTNDTPGASSDNWDQVNDAASATDETTAGGTISSDTNGHLDLYNASDLTQITGTIHAVQIGIQAAMAAAGSRTLKPKFKGTLEADGSNFLVDSTTYDEFVEVFDDNPETAAAWDVADIDGGQFGVEVVS